MCNYVTNAPTIGYITVSLHPFLATYQHFVCCEVDPLITYYYYESTQLRMSPGNILSIFGHGHPVYPTSKN